MFLKRLLRNRVNLKNFVFEITPRCNENCIYCYNVWKHCRYKKGELSAEKWKEIIVKLKEETKIKQIAISGGEPLLYEELFELIEFIKKEGITVNLLTNGSLIDEEKASKLVELGVSIFEIPLIADNAKLHRELKGTNDFEKVLEGFANLYEASAEIVSVFVATRRNIHALRSTVELSIALGAKAIMFNRINPACKEHIKLMPSVEQLKDALETLNGLAEEYGISIACSIPMPPCVIDMQQYPKISYGFCPAGNEKSYFTVDFLGNVRVCNHSPKIIGNILNESFSKILEHEYVESFKHALPEECKTVRMCSASNLPWS